MIGRTVGKPTLGYCTQKLSGSEENDAPRRAYERLRRSRPVLPIRAYLAVLLILLAVRLVPVEPVSGAASAEIQNHSSYIGSYTKSYYIVGEVLNTGDMAIRFIFVTATLKDGTGWVVDVVEGVGQSNYLPPGEKAPFRIIEDDPNRIPQVESYTLAVTFQTAPEIVLTKSLVVSNTTSTISRTGFLEVVGEVRNDGPMESRFTEVIGTFYDSEGFVVFVTSRFTSPSTIPPGESRGFKLIVNEPNQIPKIASRSLFAESEQYTSIAEWTWSPIVVVTVLALAVVAVRKKRN